MIRHVVMLRWTDGTTDDDVRAVDEALRGLPSVIPQIRRYELGPDLGLRDGNWDFVVVGDFDDTAAYAVYADDPTHQAIIADHIVPNLAERAAVQYEL